MAEQMKESGIQWIGAIPYSWNVERIKYIIQNNDNGIKVGPFGSALTNEVVSSDEGKYKVYGQSNLIRKDFSYGDNYVSEQNYKRLINYEVLPNDIAVSMMGTIGKCSVVPDNIESGIMDSHLIKIRLSQKMLPRYFEYAYESDMGYSQLLINSKGSIMNGLNSTIIKVYSSQFEKRLLNQLNVSTKLLSVKPDTLEYIYSTGDSKLVPVKLQGTVSAGRQYYISDTICTPDSVLAYAPAGVLDTITIAYTQKVKFEDVSDTLKRQIPLLAQKGVKFVPASVEMIFPVDIYTEKTVEVPLRGVNFPAGKVLRAFPSKVNVTFQVGLSHFRQITASDFHINVSYEELLKLGSDKYTVKLRSVPKGVNQIRISPEQVDFLIEQVSPDYGN